MTCPGTALPGGHRKRKRSPLKPRRFRSRGLVRQSTSCTAGAGAGVAAASGTAHSRAASAVLGRRRRPGHSLTSAHLRSPDPRACAGGGLKVRGFMGRHAACARPFLSLPFRWHFSGKLIAVERIGVSPCLPWKTPSIDLGASSSSLPNGGSRRRADRLRSRPRFSTPWCCSWSARATWSARTS